MLYVSCLARLVSPTAELPVLSPVSMDELGVLLGKMCVVLRHPRRLLKKFSKTLTISFRGAYDGHFRNPFSGSRGLICIKMLTGKFVYLKPAEFI